MDEQFIKKPWYKTSGGIAFLSVLSVILLLVLTFAGFFVFYSIQLKFGDAGKLAKEFTQTQTGMATTKSLLEKLIKVEKPEQYIRKHDAVLGAEKAQITIVEFVDFECAYSREAYSVIKSVTQKYNSVVRIVFKHLPSEQLNPDAEIAANASACAKTQGKFWEYHDLLFERKKLDLTSLLDYARELKLNTDQFNLCLTENKFEKDIAQDMMDAAQLGLKGTPTYIVNGYKIEGT
ncbi:MAG: thioredoxin domain-containing protein, partial [Patescibacteria group bacterium]